MILPDASITVERLGREGEPLVIIDNFTGQPERLRAMGLAAQYYPAGVDYPGRRALADPSYLSLRRELMMQVMGRVFGLTRNISCEIAAFSLVTLPPELLSPRQRIPHHDHSDAGRVAIMHYLDGPESGGTAFYRHRRTGFEAITPEREVAYAAALVEDEREFGPPPAGYPLGNSDAFEQIGAVEARPDRMALYRGRQLHSGIIPDPAALSEDPAKGRLTVNMFLFGS
ncbi:hypothetical protein FHS52_002526 [Erythromicrobium ramosum]|uniref:Uncharacterized protein n=1 Tax=Erythrobacter ramosus TaxID=35811 RepID=A0A6I4UIQ0_9SPHN|nr:DUF6445 family protein [Erythrobacter ramosus]MBB3776557.1 hypothetical protein [Erythrobacter ramosus]MXP38366.1 hypothetical protein [Erythrobacter ramosus]